MHWFNAGYKEDRVNGLLNPYNAGSRITDLNIDFSRPEYQNKVTYLLATPDVTEGMPPAESAVINLGWDKLKYGAQIAVDMYNGRMFLRSCNDKEGFSRWGEVISDRNYKEKIFYGQMSAEEARFTLANTGNWAAMQVFVNNIAYRLQFGINAQGTLYLSCLEKSKTESTWKDAPLTFLQTFIMKDVTLFDGKNSQKVMQAFDDGDNANNGCELVIGGNGNTFVGAGESPSALRAALQAGPAEGGNLWQNN